MSEHALLSPSSAHRWMRCVGSLAATPRSGDDSSSEFAREGTAAHLLGERALGYQRPCTFWLGETITVKYTEKDIMKSQTFVIDEEMCEFVQVYVDQVNREPGELLVEERLNMEPVYGVEGQFGTGDAVVLDHENERMYVGDLKYGRGVIVFAKDNEQAYSYGAAALREYDMIGDWKTITVAIHQPRLNHYDEHTLTRAELEAWIEQAREKAQLAHSLISAEPEAIEANLTPGEKQCQWCPRKGNCKPLAEWMHATVFADFEALDVEPKQVRDVATLSNEQVGEFWFRRDLIASWISEVQAEAKRRLEAGFEGLGLKLVQGRMGNRKFSSETEAEEIMKAARIKQDEMYTKKLLSAPQAEKAFKKTKPKVWAKLEAIVTQEQGAPAVAPLDDARPALVVAKADQFNDENDFSDLC